MKIESATGWLPRAALRVALTRTSSSGLTRARWVPQSAPRRRGLPEDGERSGNSLAAEMESRRAHLNRVLDPEASNVILSTLSRAARVLSRALRVELLET